MIDQPTPAATSRNPWIAMLLPWVLIGQFLWNLLTPAHEFPMRTEQVMTMTIDALMLAGLIGLRGAMPKARSGSRWWPASACLRSARVLTAGGPAISSIRSRPADGCA